MSAICDEPIVQFSCLLHPSDSAKHSISSPRRYPVLLTRNYFILCFSDLSFIAHTLILAATAHRALDAAPLGSMPHVLYGEMDIVISPTASACAIATVLRLPAFNMIYLSSGDLSIRALQPFHGGPPATSSTSYPPTYRPRPHRVSTFEKAPTLWHLATLAHFRFGDAPISRSHPAHGALPTT